ncbi:hypothetical protein JNB_03300 [Janibacter sp. HTCC2649]|uniref:hypothetical protein n=1 Tax=Janibacter sp. HTCC2649 TaxID=313589 RepID=UPI000066EAE9|nr:hypothetical protein [Janibacter sp. HTCC2649]EAP99162.1 hypothetical protein JNB_03300 [Janibacter sp. HTCC2649]
MARHTTRRFTSAAFGLALVGASGIAFTGAAHADPNKNITICHATSSTSNEFVVIKVDASSIVEENGHSEHQGKQDVIPPFEYVSENTEETVSFDGLNWDDNWETNGEGVALEKVTKADCMAPGSTSTPTPTVTPTSTPTSTSTMTPTSTPTGTSTPSGPTGPVVETDLVDPAGPNPALLGGGAALLLAGAAASVAAARRRGSHS